MTPAPWVKFAAWTLGILVGVIAACVGLVFLVGAVSRYQARSDAANGVSIRKTQIKTAQQQKQIERINAQIKFIRATGTRRAQDEIDKTLTPLYVQWEAVQAMFALANSQATTAIYIPVGANGVPLVSTTGTQSYSGKVTK